MLDWLFQRKRYGERVQRLLDLAATTSPRTTTDTARDRGRQWIVGEITGDAELVAPMTGRRCVYWMMVVAEVGAGDSHDQAVAERGLPFLVRDDRSAARVVADGANLDLPGEARERGSVGTVDGLTDPERALFPHGGIRLNYPASSGLRITEYCLTPGDRVMVLGVPQLEPDPDARGHERGYRAAAAMRPVFSASRWEKLWIGVPRP